MALNASCRLWAALKEKRGVGEDSWFRKQATGDDHARQRQGRAGCTAVLTDKPRVRSIPSGKKAGAGLNNKTSGSCLSSLSKPLRNSFRDAFRVPALTAVIPQSALFRRLVGSWQSLGAHWPPGLGGATAAGSPHRPGRVLSLSQESWHFVSELSAVQV